MEENNEQNNFIEEIENLYRLHYITKKHDHMIGLKRGGWRLFEPSKFIYAYFAFNSFYNFKWDESLEKKELIVFPEKIEKKGKLEYANEFDKYKSMIDFIFKHEDKKGNDKKHFFKIICGDKENKVLIETIKTIKPDNRIQEWQRDCFKNKFEELIKSRDIKVKELIKYIVRFVYLVRNNIFHGKKNTIKMSEKSQRERLEIYTNIIVALNQLLFNILEREIGFTPHSNYKIS